jgi:hypothetical protein
LQQRNADALATPLIRTWWSSGFANSALYDFSKVILPVAAPPEIKLSVLLVLRILSILLVILFIIATAEG